MDVPVAEVLKPGLKFSYTYDFGSSTDLLMRVVSEREGALKEGDEEEDGEEEEYDEVEIIDEDDLDDEDEDYEPEEYEGTGTRISMCQMWY